VRGGARTALLAGAMVLAVAPGFAQGLPGGVPGQGGLHQRGESRGSGGNSPAPAPPPLKATPDPWPRLDPGAILCGSEDGLKEYQEGLATATADAPAPLPADCRRVLERTAVSIVQRDGPGRVQVQSATRTGWTDVWLPDQRP
jgi:hypothetical protein